MRSRSTLLSHLLSNNQQILSIGETTTFYKTQRNFAQVLFHNLFENRTLNFKSKYILEQATSNKNTPDLALLNSNNSKLIILIREPKATIKSMIAYTKGKNDYWNEKKAISYYCERLNFIKESFVKKDTNNYIIVDSDELINETDIVFKRIENFLGLVEPLSDKYLEQKFTSKRGDDSPNINKGQIVKETRDHQITLHEDYSDPNALFFYFKNLIRRE